MLYNSKPIFIKSNQINMANVHGFGDVRNNANNPNRQPMLDPSDNDNIMKE